VFENRVLRKIFERKSTEVGADCRRLHNKELYKIYSSPNFTGAIKSGILEYAGHLAHVGDRRGAYRVLVGRPNGKRTLGRPRRRWGTVLTLVLNWDGEA
jgi:hypothetical protein